MLQPVRFLPAFRLALNVSVMQSQTVFIGT